MQLSKSILVILFTTLTFIISGCSNTPTYNKLNVTQTQIKPLTIPGDLLINCTPSELISKEEYLKLPFHERESYLSGYTIGVLSILSRCNAQIEQIRKLNEEYNKDARKD